MILTHYSNPYVLRNLFLMTDETDRSDHYLDAAVVSGREQFKVCVLLGHAKQMIKF